MNGTFKRGTQGQRFSLFFFLVLALSPLLVLDGSPPQVPTPRRAYVVELNRPASAQNCAVDSRTDRTDPWSVVFFVCFFWFAILFLNRCLQGSSSTTTLQCAPGEELPESSTKAVAAVWNARGQGRASRGYYKPILFLVEWNRPRVFPWG